MLLEWCKKILVPNGMSVSVLERKYVDVALGNVSMGK